MEERTTRISEAAAERSLPPFGIKDKIGYALGDFGCNMSFSLVTAFMYIFYTQYIGLSSTIWSAIIIVVKVWDAVNDPIMGGLMDAKKPKKGGKFKPWIKLGSYGLIIGGALVFLPIPNAPTAVKVIVCIVSYLLWDVSYTVVNVPYGAFNAAISADTGHRASLSVFRSIGGGLGGLVSMVLPALLFDENNVLLGGRLIWAGVIMGVIAFISFWLFLIMTTERVEIPVETYKFNFFKTVGNFFKNRAALAVSIASFLLLVFFMSTTTTNTLVYQIYFARAKMTTIVSIVSYAPLVILVPFASKIVKKFGKKLAAGVPLILSAAAAGVLLLIPMDRYAAWSAWVYIAGLAIIQFGGGMFQLVCWAMIADCIDYQHIKTGRRDEGSIYAIYSLFRKLAQGVGAALIPMCMAWVGYVETQGPNQTAQAAENMKDMSLYLVLLGSLAIAAVVLLFYNLGKKEVEDMNKKLGKLAELNLSEAVTAMKE
jgi:GPH family glycoside/pentoside/hexuronide:cation symporter